MVNSYNTDATTYTACLQECMILIVYMLTMVVDARQATAAETELMPSSQIEVRELSPKAHHSAL